MVLKVVNIKPQKFDSYSPRLCWGQRSPYCLYQMRHDWSSPVKAVTIATVLLEGSGPVHRAESSAIFQFTGSSMSSQPDNWHFGFSTGHSMHNSCRFVVKKSSRIPSSHQFNDNFCVGNSWYSRWQGCPRCWKETTTYENDVWLLPRQFDEKVATLHLPTLDAALIVLAQDKQFPSVSSFKAFSRVFSFTGKMLAQIDLLRYWLLEAAR